MNVKVNVQTWKVVFKEGVFNSQDGEGDRANGFMSLSVFCDGRQYGPFDVNFHLTSGGDYLDGDPLEVFAAAGMPVKLSVLEFHQYVNAVARHNFGPNGRMIQCGPNAEVTFDNVVFDTPRGLRGILNAEAPDPAPGSKGW